MTSPLSYDPGEISLLAVEDEADARDMLVRSISLKFPSVRISIAENGAEGLERFREDLPDIVLADMNMPVVDGIQMAREIRAVHPDAIIIAVTAYNDPTYLLNAINVGIRSYVLKPIENRILFDAIDKSIREIMLKRRVGTQERLIHLNERQLSEAQKITHLGSWEWHRDTGKTIWSMELYRILGLQPDSAEPTSEMLLERVHPEDRQRVGRIVEQALENKLPIASHHCRIVRPDGAIRIVLCQGEVIQGDSGDHYSVVGTVHDITEQRRTEEERARLASIVETSNDAILAANLDGIIISWNRGAESIYGYSPAEVVGRHLSLLVPPDRSEVIAQIPEMVRSGQNVINYETVHVRKDGKQIFVSLSASPARDIDGRVMGTSIIARDVTERREMENFINYRAYHDMLTDLPNRQLFMDFLGLELAQARRNGKKLALLFLDLNDFKKINDNLGHNAGDQLLQEVARRLRACIRESDTVARLGGDEFTVLMPDLGQTDDVGIVLRKILKVFEAPFPLNGIPTQSSTSIGVSMFPDDGDSSDELIKKADIAMYDAKGAGKNVYRFYNAEIHSRTRQRQETECYLREAIAKGELRIAFQPIISSESGELVAAEALLRWHHPHLGLLLPEQFLSIAEDSGAIVLLGEWGLREACRQMRKWHDKGLIQTMAINLSNRQLHQPDFIGRVTAILTETGIDPTLLAFEVSEGALMDNSDGFAHTFANAIAGFGISLTIDNFGCGPSSLQGMMRLPIAAVKIDRHVIHNMHGARESLALVNAVISMARDLNLKVIASGVENKSQLSETRKSGCDELQGFLISAPLPADHFEALCGKRQIFNL